MDFKFQIILKIFIYLFIEKYKKVIMMMRKDEHLKFKSVCVVLVIFENKNFKKIYLK